MEVSQRIAVTGMLANQRQLEVVSNNMANLNSTGFKRAVAHTTDVGYQAGITAPVDGEGRLVNASGMPVQSDTGADLTVPLDSIDVRFDDAGQLTATAADGTAQIVGRLGLSMFPNNRGLLSVGQNTWSETPASGAAVAV